MDIVPLCQGLNSEISTSLEVREKVLKRMAYIPLAYYGMNYALKLLMLKCPLYSAEYCQPPRQSIELVQQGTTFKSELHLL